MVDLLDWFVRLVDIGCCGIANFSILSICFESFAILILEIASGVCLCGLICWEFGVLLGDFHGKVF